MCSFVAYCHKCGIHTFYLVEANCGASHPAPWPTVTIKLSKECPECHPPIPMPVMPTSDLPVHINLVSDLAPDSELKLRAFSAAEYEAEIGSIEFTDSEDEDEEIDGTRFGSTYDKRAIYHEAEAKVEVERDRDNDVAPISPTTEGHLKTAVEKLFIVQHEAQKKLAEIKKWSKTENKVSKMPFDDIAIGVEPEVMRKLKIGTDEKGITKHETQIGEKPNCERIFQEKNERALITDQVNKNPFDAEKKLGKIPEKLNNTEQEKLAQMPKMLSDPNMTQTKIQAKNECGGVKEIIAKLEAASL
jgi:hypothetical protein